MDTEQEAVRKTAGIKVQALDNNDYSVMARIDLSSAFGVVIPIIRLKISTT